MASLFTVTTTTNTLRLDKKLQDEATFTVSNTSGRRVRGRALLQVQDPTAADWLSLVGEAERDFPIAGTDQFTVKISVPEDAPAGSYSFRLDVVNIERPDEDYTRGQTVTFEVPEPERERKPFPVWIALIALGVLLLGAVLTPWCALFGCETTATIPDVADMTVDEATTSLNEVGFEQIAHVGEEHSETIAQDRVIRTEPPANEEVALDTDIGLIISLGAESTFELPAVYLTDGGDSSGKIYRMSDGQLSTIYERPSGRIYSIAVGPDGEIYFSNHNDNHIYRLLPSGGETQVYTHGTYTRDVNFDHQGTLHFSEASGAGDDGRIYVLDPNTGAAVSIFTVRLSDVDGFWSGNFTFAPDGSLWLSSGNRIPASIFEVQDDRPRRVFTSDDSSITGMTFTDDGDLLYTDWRQRVYHVEMPSFIQSEVIHAPDLRWTSDIAIADN